MATPAQVANDMRARVACWKGHQDIAKVCRDSAAVIDAYLFGPPPDGRVVTGVLVRLYRWQDAVHGLGAAEVKAVLARAAATITQLRKEATDAQT